MADPTFDKPAILIAGGAPDHVAAMHAALHGPYRVRAAASGEQALDMIHEALTPDLFLLHVDLPGIDGFAVCEHLKYESRTRDIPVVFLLKHGSLQDEERAFALGAVDCLAMPVSPGALQVRVRNYLAIRAATGFLRDNTQFLESEVARRTREINAIQDVTILAMASLAEARDADTNNHIRRMQHYVRALAWKLSSHPRFRDYLTVPAIAMLFKSAPLHDIGKAAIPDRILLKKGRLSPEEFEIMKTHTLLGRDALAHAEQALGLQVDFLTMAKQIAMSHQEKWDGTGYPEGLAGERIPIAARITAVADVYDALISRRLYKDAILHDDAVQIIQSASGQHFDPDVVAAFMQIHPQLYAIALTYMDTQSDLEQKAQYLKTSQETPP